MSTEAQEAKRYRFIREHGGRWIRRDGDVVWTINLLDEYNEDFMAPGEELDDAIDRAMDDVGFEK